jgi:ribulose-bisphosphate carboxylase small chain
MRITQGTFSFLPDLTAEQIKKQVEYCLKNGWAVSIEFTDDPHPRNTYWEMWGAPMFDLKDPMAIMQEMEACRKAYPNHYIKVNASDSTRGWETIKLYPALVLRARRLRGATFATLSTAMPLINRKASATRKTVPARLAAGRPLSSGCELARS